MKKTILFFALLLSGLSAWSQDTITYTYTLDTIRRDSFFLVETIKYPSPGLPRGYETKNNYFFRDTASFNVMVRALKSDSANIGIQVRRINDEKNAIGYRIARLECLRDSVFSGASCTGSIGRRTLLAPPTEAMEAQAMQPDYGYWIIYTDNTRAYIPPGAEPLASGTILYPGGGTRRFVKPKPQKK